MRLTERSMLRIAKDVHADDLAHHADLGDPGPVDSNEDHVAHRHWLKERVAATTAPVERVRFRVKWSGRTWRLPSFGGQG